MLWVWIFILIGLFIVGVTYFQLTPTIIEIFTTLQLYGAPEWFISWVIKAYHIAFIILAVGIVLYGIIQATKEEPDTYRV